MARWDKEDIPHKGWVYVGIEDLAEGMNGFGGDIPYEQCEMCGNERIRYVHILKHPDYKGEIRVGCVCAEKMTEDYSNPNATEREVKNRYNRRKNFFRKEWTLKSNGNYTLRYKGKNITIMKSKYGPSWGVAYDGEFRWDYKGKKIRSLDVAKSLAFEMFDEMYESSRKIKGFWDGNRLVFR